MGTTSILKGCLVRRAVYLARALVFGVSPRALLAVAALALSVTYALVAAASLGGLGSDSETIQAARADQGWVVLPDQGEALSASSVPPGATAVRLAEREGIRLASIDPWPYEDADAVWPPTAVAPTESPSWLGDARVTSAAEPVDFVPADSLAVRPSLFDTIVPERGADVDQVFVPGSARPAGSNVHPWQGVATFYDEGAKQLRSGLVVVVLAAGAVSALLSAGFAHLEVLARRADLATVEALAGRRLVNRLVTGRVATVVGAGLVVGTAAALAVVRVAAVSGGGASFRIGLGALAATWIVTGIGATLAGTLAGRRVLGGSFRSRAGDRLGVRRFPGPIRFLVVTPRVFVSTLVATLVSVSILAVVIQSAAIPVELFGATEDDEVVIAATTGNPLRGTTDRFLGEAGRYIEGVRAAMPETFVPTVLDERPVLVKGTDFVAWRSHDAPDLLRGSWPDAEAEATVGVRAARILDLGVGDRVWVPASYHKGGEHLLIVGVHEVGDLDDDEVWTDLDTAGRLAGLPPEKTTLVRIRLDDPGTPWSAVAPQDGIELSNIAIEPPNPPPLSPAVVTVTAVNFGDRAAQRDITVRLNDNITGHATIHLDGHGRAQVRVPVITPGASVFRIEINPTRDVQAARTSLVVDVPEVGRPRIPFLIDVTDTSGAPVVGADVLVDGEAHATTDADGGARVLVIEPGLVTITVRGDGEASGGAVLRVAPTEWDGTGHLVVEDIFLNAPVPINGTHARIRAEARLVNLGDQAADRSVAWRIGNDTVATSQVRAAASHRASLETTFVVREGTHELRLLNHTVPVNGVVSRPDDAAGRGPATVEELLEQRRQRGAANRATPDDPTGSFLEDVFAGLETATTMVVLVTLAHAGALVWIGITREVREREAVVEQLRAIGASGYQVEGRALRDTAVSMVPPVVLGIVVAHGALAIAGYFGLPAAFGHTLPGAEALGASIRVGIALLVIGLAAAFTAVQRGARRPPSAPERPPTMKEMWEGVR